MKAILVKQPGGAEQLTLGEYPDPAPGPRQVLVKVAASALNRADLLQRQGKYPPPPGESPILGLEMAGEVVAFGAGATRWKLGDRVCGLLGGGGYAEYALIHEDLAMPVPENLSWVEAAAIPEVFLTAFQALEWLGRLRRGEWVLIHAGASGVGTAAIQLAREMDARVAATASATKHDTCLRLGAETAIDYQQQDFAREVQQLTQGRGVDLIVDFVAAPYFQRNLEALAMDGRLVMLALMGGARLAEADLSAILRKRLHITGSTLRNRSLEYKIALSAALRAFAWPRFADGRLRPVVDSVFEWTKAAEAHRYMESNRNQGKIVLAMR
jgi:tumor protein p53-inducible protein 3